MAKKTKGKARGKKRKSPQELAQARSKRQLYRELRNLITSLGFKRILSDDIEIQVAGRTGEIDDIFIHENVILAIEYTVGKPSSSHILKKIPLYQRMLLRPGDFIDVARSHYAGFADALNPQYDDDQYHIRILYVPMLDAAQETIDACPDVTFFQGSLRKYFVALGKTIQRSARVEFFSFLKLAWDDVGPASIKAASSSINFTGHLLPESMSSFPAGFKVVSFYADPESLIAGAYVLRRDGWRDETHMYQRILVRAKIAKMRKYLIDQKRVFINNIIVTLPADTAINKASGKNENLDEKQLAKAQAVSINIPTGHGIIGIIDGQHRIFCYHEGEDSLDPQIAVLRTKQHLLVTGIIYPPHIREKARLEFEARLFLEINDTQTRARPGLRQDIETIVRPFSGIAVARRVIADMSKRGAFAGAFQLGYFDSPSKIKTSSIVSYGLRPLVKFDGLDSLFHAWTNPKKQRLKEREKRSVRGTGYDEDLELLEHYIQFCVKVINDFMLAAKLCHGTDNWDVEAETPSELLRPTSINGLIACLRRVIEADLPLNQAAHTKAFRTLSSFEFSTYRSSQWDALGQLLFRRFFQKSGSPN